ncbi:permease [Clostridium fermenticellae]|uniref:Permease n=1 Tax=Clostridium fermenticellae TaxID=2068654 RepID=A0A386H1I3_9CLOT|nr:permease [Clostridium fermenticellae]AYD39542.1 permease [Clostridium fermenticellae]
MIVQKNKLAKNFIMISICIPILTVLCLSISLLLPPLHFSLPNIQYTFLRQNKMIQGFSTIFLSIILEAFPFIMVGTILSSMIQIFVSEETLTKIIPQNKFLGSLGAALTGLIFPICDCAIVPVARRLIKKGLPLHIGITFMLSVPILNPVVLASTYYAFSNNIYIVIIRGLLGIIGAMIIGNIIGSIYNKDTIFKNKIDMNLQHHHKHMGECQCGCGHSHHNLGKKHNLRSIIVEIIDHTTIELHDVGKFIIIGSFLSALMQTVIPRKYILLVGHDKIYSILVMIGLAFLLAVCSETDAFIARTFVGQFTTGSIIAFLIFGPMIDIKNTLMLSTTFKTTFIIKLIFAIFTVCFTIGVLVNYLGFNGGLIL